MKFTGIWDSIFASAHLYSWPTASLCIANSKPKEGRNVFQEDEEEIMKAAKKHGYTMIFKSLRIVYFLKK